jgi:hypothetical protein
MIAFQTLKGFNLPAQGNALCLENPRNKFPERDSSSTENEEDQIYIRDGWCFHKIWIAQFPAEDVTFSGYGTGAFLGTQGSALC